jgi:hypothetical protein
MKIDGNKFKTYLLDNEFTIKRRFANLNNVISDFINLEIKSNEPEIEYESTNLIKIINKYTINELDKLNEINNKYFHLSMLDLMCLWCYVKYKSKIPSTDNSDFYYLSSYIEKNNIMLDHIENNMSYFLKKIKDKLDYTNSTVVNEKQILEYFDKIEEVHSSDLIITKIKKEYVYTVNVDSCNFFDSINLSNNIPFASLKDFYKIFKGFKPLTKWIFLNDDLNIKDTRSTGAVEKEIITLKVSSLKNTPLKDQEDKFIENKNLNEKKNQDFKDQIYNNVYITFKSSWDEYLEEKKLKEKIEMKDKQKIKLLELTSKKMEKEKEQEKEKEKEKEKVKRKITKTTSKNEIENEELKAKKEKEKEVRELKKKEKEEILKKQLDEEKELEKRKIELELEETIKQKKKEYKMYILIESELGDKKGELNEKELLERVLSCFTVPVKLLKEGVEKQVQSEFLMPKQLIDFPIFKDMFLNNFLYRKFLQIDERLSIYKYKKNMYFYFISDENESKNNYIACSLIQRKVEKSDTKIIAKDPKNLTVGSYYILLKILRSNNSNQSEQFKKIFCKFIQYYNKNKDKIIEEYKNILTEENIDKLLEQERQVKEQKRYIRHKELLKDIDPEKFIPGYARICEKKYAPKILNEKEVEKYFGDSSKDNVENRKHIMLYPKSENEGKQYYYSCKDNKKNHLYPGLQRNYLDNFDKFPVVPCCFVTEQSKKQDSPYSLYYGEKDMNFELLKEHFLEKDEKDTASHIITTQKFITPGRFGVLPKDIISFIHSIDPINLYYRKGSLRTVDSVLDVLLYARKKEYEDYSVNEKYKTIKMTKEKMVKLIKENNIKYFQESYNVNMIQILNENGYINPHIFLPVLEYIFDCNILIFKRDERYPDGILSCPNFDKEYLLFEPDKQRKYVLIYEHMGSETDNAKYPQCEIIFKYKENTLYPTFKYNSFIKNIINCFKKLYPVKIFKNINNIFKKYNIVSYSVDDFGKTVYIIVKYKNKIIHLITNPLPNFSLDITQTVLSFSKFENFNDTKLSYEFGTEENINLTSFVKNGIFYGFQGTIDYITFYIPTNPTKTSGNIKDNEIDFPIIDPKNNKISINKLEIYNEYKNISRLIVEYFYYLFSIDYNIYKPDIIDNDYIQNFINRNIIISPKTTEKSYKLLLLNSRVFNIDIFKNSVSQVDSSYSIPVPNINVLKKLVYNLKLKLDRDYLKLLNYNNLQYIPSSFSEVDDFKNSIENNNIVIKGKYPMIMWIKSTKNIYNVYDEIQLPRVSIYHEIDKILEQNQKNNLLILVFISKWSKPSKNIQNKLYSPKTHKLIFDKYKDIMTVVYIDIDIHKAITEYFSIKTLPTFLFVDLNHKEYKLNIISRIEGDVKMYKNLKMINNEIKNILKIQDEDDLTTILNEAKDDSQLDQDIDEILKDVLEQIDFEIGDELNQNDSDTSLNTSLNTSLDDSDTSSKSE